MEHYIFVFLNQITNNNFYLLYDYACYLEISFDEVYARGLNVMDMTAFTLCKENNLPIIVFDMDTPGNLRKLMEGERVGTIVSAS